MLGYMKFKLFILKGLEQDKNVEYQTKNYDKIESNKYISVTYILSKSEPLQIISVCFFHNISIFETFIYTLIFFSFYLFQKKSTIHFNVTIEMSTHGHTEVIHIDFHPHRPLLTQSFNHSHLWSFIGSDILWDVNRLLPVTLDISAFWPGNQTRQENR